MPIKAINEVSNLIGNGDGLCLSLRMTKFAKLEETGRAPIDFICAAKKSTPPVSVPNSSIFHSLPSSIFLVMRLQSRLIVNHAGGALENAGLSIHRHFNYPYIPGSAVKGVARHAAWSAWKERMEEGRTEEAREAAKHIAFTFGFPTGDSCPKRKEEMTRPSRVDYLDDFLKAKFPDLFEKDGRYEGYSGSVSFLPAIPFDSNWKIVPDIVNCHHMNYYRSDDSNEKALDTESPNPQFYPAVEAGAVFIFTVILLPSRNSVPGFNSLEFAKQYLEKGLEDHGIGAKTSSGYGWFEKDIETAAKLKAEAESARNKQEEQEKEKEEESKDPIAYAKKQILALDDQKFAEFAKDISRKSDPEQQAFFDALMNEKNEVLKRWKKNKPKNIDAIKPVADKLNITI